MARTLVSGILGAALVALATAACCLCADSPPKQAEAIYDTKADGHKQVAAALEKAQKSDQRVLLVFGANWCGWCRKLHTLFAEDKDVRAALAAGYVVVWIDVDEVDGAKHNQALDLRYDHPTQFGLPAIVILDSLGNQLFTQDTNKLEEGKSHSPQKVLAMLDEWKPKKSNQAKAK